LSVLQDAVRVEGERLSEARSEYQKLQESLSGADERENAAAEELEKARNTESEKRSAFDSADAAARSQRGSADFGTEAEADAALDAAIRKEDESSKVFAEAEKAGTKAQENVTRALSLLNKYEEEIPQDGADTDQKQKEYKALLREKDLTEPEWMDLVSGHDRGEIETLRKETKKYGEDMSAAKARLEAAEKLTAGREKPDMNALGEELKEADRVYNEAGTSCEEMKEYCRDDQKALEGLLAHRTRRQKAARDYSRIDRLYKLLSGNVTGSRMDIETYVQRYYLERILDAANTRFDEMTSGQYELRMVDDEEAGEGRNRGLDLCVFSTVTGKEREIRSLSGGESFMAALSLALGMADVITQSSSAIRLDVMFIDEGFGTLDDQSRRQAVDVLKRMAESHRMVGIISHVSELKTEIEDQLIVTRDDRGSHVHWEMS
jgi:exonuclease SbcC